MSTRKQIFIGVLVVILWLCGFAWIVTNFNSDEPEKPKTEYIEPEYDDTGYEEATTEIIEKTVIKKVYVDEDFSSYDVDSTGVSYWFVFYTLTGGTVRGQDIVEINGSYFDYKQIKEKIDSQYSKPNKFVGITFFKRMTFEEYKIYNENDE